MVAPGREEQDAFLPEVSVKPEALPEGIEVRAAAPEGVEVRAAGLPTLPAIKEGFPFSMEDDELPTEAFDFKRDSRLRLLSNGVAAPGRDFEMQDLWLKDVLKASFEDTSSRRAAEHELARRTGVPIEAVKENFDELFQAFQAAGMQPARLRRQQPDFYNMLVNDPQLASVAMKDETLVVWETKKGLTADQLKGLQMMANDQPFAGNLNLIFKDRTLETVQTKFQLQLEKTLPGALWDTLKDSGKRNILSKAGATQLYQDFLDPESTAAWDNRDFVLGITQELGPPKDYGQGAAGTALIKIVDSVSQQADSVAALALTAGAFAITKSPAASALIGKLANASASFLSETGGTYNELSQVRDEDGNKVSPNLAMAGSVLNGAFAMFVEMGTFSRQIKGLTGFSTSVAKGQGRKHLAEIIANPAKNGFLRDLAHQMAKAGKRMAANGAAEGKEEFIQQMGQILISWLTVSASAGKFQEFNMEEAVLSSFDASVSGGIGGAFGMGLAGTTFNAVTGVVESISGRRSAEIIENITETAKGDMARAAPRETAQLIKASTEREDGKKVTHMYVDPQAFIEKAAKEGVDANELATDLMGEKGPERLKTALDRRVDEGKKRATLEVPIEEFLDRWGNKPITNLLKQDMAVREGTRTAKEEEAFQKEVGAKALRILRTQELGLEEEIGPNEQRVMDLLETRMREVEKLTPNETRQNIALTRALYGTMAAELGDESESFFRQLSIEIASEESLAMEKPLASEALTGVFEKQELPKRSQEMLVDSNIGIFNSEGFLNIPLTLKRKFAVHLSVEGTKWKNNQGHDEGNYLYRLVGRVLGGISEDAAKWGGDFVTYVETEAEAAALRDNLQEGVKEALLDANPELEGQLEGLGVTSVVVPAGTDVAETVKAAAEQNASSKEALEEAGGRSPRGEKPFGIPNEDPSSLKLPQDAAPLREVPQELLDYVSGLTDSQVFNKTYLDGATGLLNGKGFNKSPARAYTAALDISGLAAINLKLGQDFGDTLLRKFAELATAAGGSSVDLAHLSGDEYAIKHDDPETLQLYIDILAELTNAVKLDEPFYDKEKGRQIEGLTFGYGIGDNYDAADRKANEQKALEVREPGTEARARADRDVDRGSEDRIQGRIDLARGVRPQGYDGRDASSRRRVDQARTAAARAAALAYRLRLEAFGGVDARDIAASLQGDVPNAVKDAVGAMVEYRIRPRERNAKPANAYSPSTVFESLFESSLEKGVEGSPTAKEDNQYRLAKRGQAEMPGPLESDLLDKVNEVLGLTDDARVKGVQHAFDLLVQPAVSKGGGFVKAGNKTARVLQRAVQILRDNVAGLENLSLPEEIVERHLQEEARRPEAQKNEEAVEELTSEDFEIEDAAPNEDAPTVEETGEFYTEKPPKTETLAQPSEVSDERKAEGSAAFDAIAEELGGSKVAFSDALRESYRRGRSIFRELRTAGFENIDEDLQRRVKEFADEFSDVFNPAPAAAARGWVVSVRRGAARAFQIFLTEDANFSTFIHESSHVYFDLLSELSQMETAPERIKTDFNRILKWLGVESADQLTEAHKEKYARAFELFMSEGETPSVKLAGAFASFRRWMGAVYQTAEDLNVELTEEMRGVFSRQLATDNELIRVERMAGMDQFAFNTMEEAGITDPKEWRKVLDLKEQAAMASTLSADRQVSQAELKVARAFKRDEMSRFRDRATAEWENRKDVQAWRLVSEGERVLPSGLVSVDEGLGRMDFKEVERLVGKGSPLIDKLRGRLPKKGGQDVGVLANLVGYSGPNAAKDMLDDITVLPKAERFINKRAKEMMLEANPELDAEIADLKKTAMKAVHNLETSKWFLEELSRLGAKKLTLEERELIREATRRAATEFVRGQNLGRLDRGKALARERAAANKAIIALAKGNFRLAKEMKLQQIFEHEVWKQLDQAMDLRESLLRKLKLFQGLKRRRKLGVAGFEFIDAADRVLDALQMSKREIGRDPIPLSDALAKLEALYGLSFDKDLLLDLEVNPPDNGWRDLTVDQASEINIALTQIGKAANEIDGVIFRGRQIAAQDMLTQFDTELGVRIDRGPAKDEPVPIWSFSGLTAALREPRAIFKEMGPTAFEFFWRGYRDGLDKENALSASVTEKVTKSWDQLPKGMKKGRFDMDLRGLKRVPLPEKLKGQITFANNRQWMWMIALNMGNESNAKRLLGGYKWDQEQVLDFLRDNMQKEEWQFVQSMWSLFDETLFPEVSKAYEQATGLPPSKIEARSIETPHGTFKGGYFPARYARDISRTSEEQDQGLLGDLAGSNHPGRVSVKNSFTKARTENFKDYVQLNWDFIPSHVMSVVHYVAFDSYVRESAKLIGDKRFRDTVSRRLGRAKYDQIADPKAGFLAAVANGPVRTGSSIQSWSGVLTLGKSALIPAAIGLSMPLYIEGAMHPGTSAAFGKVSKWQVTKAYTKAFASGSLLQHDKLAFMFPQAGYRNMREFALKNSKLLPARMQDSRRVARKVLENVGRRKSEMVKKLEVLNEASSVLLDMEDRMSSTILWTAAYEEFRDAHPNLEESEALAQAIEHADDLIEETMPVLDFASKAAFLRDRGGMGLISIFHGYQNKISNMNAATLDKASLAWAEIEQEGDAAIGSVPSFPVDQALTIAKSFGQSAAGLIVSQVLGGLIAGQGPEKDETWMSWAARRAVAAPFQLMPLIGGVAQAVFNQVISGNFRRSVNIRSTAGMAVAERLWQLGQKVADDSLDPVERALALETAVSFLPAILTGGRVGPFPTVSPQIPRSVLGVREGQGEGVAGKAADVIFGSRESRPLNPITIFTEKRPLF